MSSIGVPRSVFFVAGALSGAIGIAAGQFEELNNRPLIGCDFSSRAEASIRRQNGELSQNVVAQACAEAVQQYMETGSIKPVIIEMPRRPPAGNPQVNSGQSPGPKK
jgi:hypothetical protein